MAKTPDPPGGIVAVNIHAMLVREIIAAVNIAPGDGSGLGMRVLNNWRNDGRWAAGVVRMYLLTAFHYAPTIIATPFDAEYHFPQVPANISHP